MATDPLSSWNNGAAKSAILDFVARVTAAGSPDFLPPAERIATFDNDGTLWCEQPLQVQFFFGHERLKALAEKDPSLKERQPFKAYLERDTKTMHDLGKKGLFEVGAFAHSGMAEDEFRCLCLTGWRRRSTPSSAGIHRADLPAAGRAPAVLRDSFKIFIVSGGGIGLIRSLSKKDTVFPGSVVGSRCRPDSRYATAGRAHKDRPRDRQFRRSRDQTAQYWLHS